jgi:TetR/AcrR family transcriptional repressor of nem operon
MNKLSTTADTILACAHKLIAKGGYNGFSYADIADVVGIRKPSIHHHFPSKAELVTTLVSSHREATRQGVANLQQNVAAPLDQLRTYIEYWKACIGDASAPFCVCALLASELPILPAEVAQEVLAYFRYLSGWLTSVLALGVQQGAIVLGQSPRVEAEAFMATVHGAMVSARVYGDTGMFGAIMDTQLARMAA